MLHAEVVELPLGEFLLLAPKLHHLFLLLQLATLLRNLLLQHQTQRIFRLLHLLDFMHMFLRPFFLELIDIFDLGHLLP